MKIDENWLKKNFVDVLNDLDISYGKITISRKQNLDAIIAVKWYENGRIKLQYREMLEEYSSNEIKALLKHEACHILTLPSSKLVMKSTYKGKAFFKYVMVYREFIAHQEFLKRFGIDENLTFYHKRHFKMYDLLVEESRKIWVSKKYHKYPEILDAVFGIMYDSIYFFVMGGDSFYKWCREKRLEKFNLFLKWVSEDMKYFYNLTGREEQKVDLIQAAAIFPISIDVGNLLTNDVIIMMKKVFDRHDPRLRDLANKWIDRVKSNGTIQNLYII